MKAGYSRQARPEGQDAPCTFLRGGPCLNACPGAPRAGLQPTERHPPSATLHWIFPLACCYGAPIGTCFELRMRTLSTFARSSGHEPAQPTKIFRWNGILLSGPKVGLPITLFLYKTIMCVTQLSCTVFAPNGDELQAQRSAVQSKLRRAGRISCMQAFCPVRPAQPH